MNYKALTGALKLYFEMKFPVLLKPREFRVADKVFKGKLDISLFSEIELWLLADIFPKASVIFDIGANIGLYTYCFRQFGNNLKIYSFEPIPLLYKRLKKLFPNVSIFPYAFSDKSSLTFLRIPYINGIVFRSRASLNLDFKEINEKMSLNIRVQTISIDEFAAEQGLESIGLIKIDVEGYELKVLQGSQNCLLKFKPILLIEIEQRHHSNTPIELIFNYISKFEYSGFFVDNKNKIIRSINEFAVSQHQEISSINTRQYINNFIFLPKHSNILEKLKVKIKSAFMTI